MTGCFFISEPFNLPEYHECHCRQSDGEEYNQRESERLLFQMNLHIHAIEAGNQCRKHQDYRQPCHAFHDCIHIIRDNRDEGIHCSRENVNVAGIISRFHLQCLPGSILFCKKTEISFARLL